MSPWLLGGLLCAAAVAACALLACLGLRRRHGARVSAPAMSRDEVERAKARELAEVLDLLPEAVLVLGPDGAPQHANPAAVSLGLLPELAEGDLAAAVAGVRATGAPRDGLEVEAADAAGRPRRLRVNVRAHGDRVVLSLADVTERHAARQALAASELLHRTLVESLHEGVVLQEADASIVAANARAEELLGLTRDQLLGRTSMDPRWRAVHEDGTDWPGEEHPVPRALASGEHVGPETMGVRTPEGELRWLEVNATPLRDEAGRVTGAVSSFVDVTARRLAEGALRASERELRTTLEGMAEGVVLLDAHGGVRALNRAAIAMGAQEGAGVTRADLTAGVELVGADGRLLRAEDLPAERAARTGEPVRAVRVEARRREGGSLWLDVNAVPVPTDEPGRPPVVVSFTDVSDRVARERALAEAQERARATFHAAPIGMTITDVDGTMVEVNAAMAELLGTPAEELLGLRARDLLHPADRDASRRARESVLRGDRGSARMEARLLRADGTTVWVQLDRTALRDPDGEPTGVVVQVQDISERRDHEAQLRHLADHDALTGLLNRRGFGRVLADQVRRVGRYGDAGALLVLDLDGFKRVNDHFGHATGDALLAAVASLLRGCLRRSDHLARLGGDEFAILLPEGDEAQASEVARKVVDALRASRTALPGADVAPVRASVGVVAMRVGVDEDELLQQADLAMYAAKDAGGDRHALAVLRPEGEPPVAVVPPASPPGEPVGA